jgi:hypothetical protein
MCLNSCTLAGVSNCVVRLQVCMCMDICGGGRQRGPVSVPYLVHWPESCSRGDTRSISDGRKFGFHHQGCINSRTDGMRLHWREPATDLCMYENACAWVSAGTVLGEWGTATNQVCYPVRQELCTSPDLSQHHLQVAASGPAPAPVRARFCPSSSLPLCMISLFFFLRSDSFMEHRIPQILFILCYRQIMKILYIK